MSINSKVFTYEVNGLSYTITVYEEAGEYFADINVSEGAMDVNAIYFGDDDQSGKSASLGGPLNMNGTKTQFDDATALSDPGLGREGTEKETYLTEGDTLTVSLDIESLEALDVIGIRATSTSTDEGSIKAVSDDPEVFEESSDDLYPKIFFGEVFDDDGFPRGGTFILEDEPVPNEFNVPSLPEGTEPTFENYLNYFDSPAFFDPVSDVTSVVFYETTEDGGSTEAFRIDAPEGGWANAEELLADYDDTIASMEEDAPADDGSALIAALSFEPEADVLMDDADSVDATMDDEIDII